MAKKKTESTEVATYSPELVKSIQSLEFYKQEIDAQANNCLQIKVVDDSTLAIGQQNLSKINQLVKLVDDKRAKFKAPYFEAGTLIDKTAKDLVELAVKAVEHLKSEVKEWELKKQKEAAEAKALLEKQQAEAQEKLASEEKRKADIRSAIDRARTTLQNCYNACISVESCDAQEKYILDGYKPIESFEEFGTEAYELRDNYLSLIRTKKVQLQSADTMSESEIALAKQKEELAKQKMDLAAREAEVKAQEDAIAAEKAAKSEAERVKAEQAKIDAAAEMDKTRNIRSIWKFELIDKSKLIPDWTCMDETVVKEFLKVNKDSIQDGAIINGVKFYKDISVIS